MSLEDVSILLHYRYDGLTEENRVCAHIVRMDYEVDVKRRNGLKYSADYTR